MIQFRPDNRENHRLSLFRLDHLHFPIQPTTLSKVDPKQITDYQAKYFAYELTKRSPSDSMEKLAGAVASAQVDLNPHQVDAALFAFRSPLSKGALLADEVGLGKTIEAGLVLSQKWAERKRRILIIVPSNLAKTMASRDNREVFPAVQNSRDEVV